MRQTFIRASSLGDLFDCPARWEAKYLRGMRLPMSGAAALGTAVHAGTALFDSRRLEGDPLTADEAAGAVVDALRHPREEVDWQEYSPAEAERLAIPLHMLYCQEVGSRQKYMAVEAECEGLELTDIGITLTGTVDRVRRGENGLGIVDIKTGKAAVGADGSARTAGHVAQLGVYELLAQAALGAPMREPAWIVGLQVAKTERGRRLGVGQVENARDTLLDDEDLGPGLLRMAAGILARGDFYGNPRSMLCTEKFCPAFGMCRWRK